MNVTNPTELNQKAKQVFDSVYQSIGGSGSDPDIATFRKQVDLTREKDPKAIETAWHDQVWNNLLQPLVTSGGGPLPETVQEQVSYLAEAMHRSFSESAIGART